MKARCPTSPDHKRFYTTAHVLQEWIVDENGDFIEDVANLETTHGPDTANIWTCEDCGAQAVFE